MSRKTRAQLDAERLAALEAAQGKVDTGEISIQDAERAAEGFEDDGAAAREAMYQELEAQLAERQSGQIQQEQREPERQQEQRHQEPAVDPRELAELKRKLSFYEQELNPAQKRAQQLEREVEELRQQLAARPVAPEGPVDYGLTEDELEFETVTNIAKKVAKVTTDNVSAKLLKEVEGLKSKLAEFEGLNTQNKIDAEIARHRTALSAALGGDNPDELFSNPKIVDWANEQSEEEVLALRNPIAYSPKFVAGLLTRFKAEVLKGQAKRLPSHGESSVPSRVAPDVVERKGGSNGSEPTFNPRTFQADVNKLISEGKTAEAERLVAVAERAMSA